MIRERSPLAGQTVTIRADVPRLGGKQYVVEDWWQNVADGSWMDATGNPAALTYAFRAGVTGLPTDNEVLYGKVGGLGHLVHVSEVDQVAADHSKCDFAWKPVKCDRCGTEYQCTPSSDFYCTPEGDHCCEPCLLGGMGAATVVTVDPGRDFLLVDTDPLEGAHAEEDSAYAEGWEAPGDRQHDNPIACPPDCYYAKDYTTGDRTTGLVDSCWDHKPKTAEELRAAVEAARR